MVKNFLRRLMPQVVLNKRKALLEQKNFDEWEKNGAPVPSPHLAKQMAISEYQKKYGHTVLVETGTYMGDMVEAQKNNFKKIYSIELNPDFVLKAKKRFQNKPHIKIVEGDSGKVLVEVIKEINEPAIFWLDGHYSGGFTAKGEKECPIYEELESIFTGKALNHIFLIDDARCFNGTGSYPTIEELTAFIKSKNDKYQFELKHDMIRFVMSPAYIG